MSESDVPSYPRLAADTKLRLDRQWFSYAWAGTPEKLGLLQKQAQDALELVYDKEVRRLLSPPAGEEDGLEISTHTLGEALRLRVQVEAKGNLTRSGEISAVLAEMDLRDVEKVRMWNSRGDQKHLPQVMITLLRGSNNSSLAPIQLRVSGSDRQWVGGTLDVLSTELGRARPWWSWIRRGYFGAFLGVILALAGGVRLVASGNVESLWLIFVTFPILGLVIGGILFTLSFQALFPALEVVEPGGTPQGRKVVGGAVALVSFGLSLAGLVIGVMTL